VVSDDIYHQRDAVELKDKLSRCRECNAVVFADGTVKHCRGYDECPHLENTIMGTQPVTLEINR